MRLYCVLRNITERKRTEQNLKDSEEKYRSVVDNIGIGVTLINAQRQILRMNAQMLRAVSPIPKGQPRVVH